MLFLPKNFSRSIDGHGIEEVEQTKFRGVILDNKLNWYAHWEYICVIIIKARDVSDETAMLLTL